ncbi:type II toxin-antitoxin system prevent-host-death family antitoxin [Propionimicrobium sp. PCR01-08-3]|uniref:type II toxin-antitoxin system Phd/YefM family antitoxin n=1 Tax=Propionimicrobium sp. PCR01-08-3 TaxID=3052086 RepID=UPI00255C9404|nr:type II toxin-antitoxin system prevent-host-death family antitoxin [Propionimicrobium sp. PCR01-08-3]WIY82917.1 type II toxin-antitoxin system prevent-host-death family antitoxin [Propionimicrobium sp. PCR01-08-3]
MSVHQVNVYEAKAQLSKLIESALKGEEVIIARAGKPAVRLVKWTPRPDRIPGMWKGRVRVADDFDSFDEQDDRDWYGEQA